VIVFLLIGVLLIGACVALVGHAVALPRLRAIQRVGEIGAYGFSAEAPVADESRGALTGAVNGFAGRLGAAVAGRMGGLSEADLRRELVAAGLYDVSPVTVIGYRVLATVGLPALFLYAAAGRMGPATLVLGTGVMVALGWIAPLTILRRRARTRLARIDHELPELVDLLVVTVEAGMGFAGALQIAAQRVTGPLGDELRLALQEQSLGLSTEEALGNLVERADTEAMRSFVRSIRQGEALGVSVGQIMRNLAIEMRKRRRAAAEDKAQGAPIKILFPLVFLILPAILVVLLLPALMSFIAAFGGGS
jgi:tight adherence protein C